MPACMRTLLKQDDGRGMLPTVVDCTFGISSGACQTDVMGCDSRDEGRLGSVSVARSHGTVFSLA